jgi:integrase/recombinase XerC
VSGVCRARSLPRRPVRRGVDRALRPRLPPPAGAPDARGRRLSVRGAHDIITGIATAAGLDDDTTAHVLRHTFCDNTCRGGTDLVIVAELLRHARLETTRGYTRPTPDDRTRALDLLLVDE